MRKLLVVLFVVISFSANIFAQEVKPAPMAGTAGILFTFSGFSNLGAGNFEGGFGGKYFFTKNFALRGIVSFTNASLTEPTATIDEETSATRFGIGAAVEYHFMTKRVSPYIGGGVQFSTTSTEHSYPSGFEEKTTETDYSVSINGSGFSGGTSFTVFGAVGAEFFLFDELSLAAEYRLGLESFSQADPEVKVEGPGYSTTVTGKGASTSVIALDSQGFLTLAIYF